MKKFVSLFLSILIILSFVGCKYDRTVNTTDKISIVTTIFPYYDFAKQIAGDKTDVTMLLSPGAESHDYEPSPQDIIKINNADLFIYTGGESDKWVETILESLDSDVRTMRMFDYVTLLCAEEEHHHHHHNEEEHHDEYDEHIWTSLENAVLLCDEIAQQLSLIDTTNQDYYHNNFELYEKLLKDIDRRFREITEDNSSVIVVADRFPMRYFTHSLDIECKSLFPGCSTETQPSIRSVTEMIDYVNNNNIPVVFHIDTNNDKFAKLISEDTGAKVKTLYSCHNVTKEQFDNGETYLSLMELNLTALTEAL